LDYVDIVFAARYDDETSLEETCRAMDHLIRTEKALYWGTSEWSGAQITEANELCERLNLYKPVVEQTLYNMISRDRVESEYVGLFDKYKLGVTVWSPLAAGLLTGKYLNQTTERVNTELTKEVYQYNEWFGPEKIDKTRAMFKEFEEIAKSLGGTIPQLALAWILRNKDVSSIICAFSKIEQVDENIKAVEMSKKFTLEIDERIENLLGNRPKTQMDWRKYAPKPPRR
jgi:aryl-alcohol dehydrogenase-like predicted oxidoreductase